MHPTVAMLGGAAAAAFPLAATVEDGGRSSTTEHRGSAWDRVLPEPSAVLHTRPADRRDGGGRETVRASRAAARVPASPQPADSIRRLDVLIVVYTRSFSRALTAPQVERLHEEIVEFADFYRVYGAGRVDFRFSLLQIDRRLHRHEVGEVAPGRYYLAREDVETELRALLGERAESFDEVVAFYAWNDANPDDARLAYGGAAVGPDGSFLGDAGYNSIGVFAWNPGRIAQVAIHEVLHNIDDMFSRSGMAERFLNSDEMSRNMPTLLAERPGAFLPYYTDPEMLAYAEREQAGREMYPWWMQRIYYAWMLERTPARAWARLEYGRMVAAPGGEPTAAAAPPPLYEDVFVSRATRRLYVPLLPASGPAPPPDSPRLGLGGETFPLTPRRYALEDFDGTPLVTARYHAGWVTLPAGEASLQMRRVCRRADENCGDARSTLRVHRLRLAEIAAPARVLAYADRTADSAPIEVEVPEAAWPGPGPMLGADRIEARVLDSGGVGEPGGPFGDRPTPPAFDEVVDGRYVARDDSRLGDGTYEIAAAAAGFVVRPARVVVDRRYTWGIDRPARLESPMGVPVNLRVGVRHGRPVDGVRVVARAEAIGEVELRPIAGGDHTVNLDGLPPGLHDLTVVAERDGDASEAGAPERVMTRVRVYARPRGWIRVPRRIETAADRRFTLAASVIDRMGVVTMGAGLPLVAISGGRVIPLRETATAGEYEGEIVLPAGRGRVYVTSLVGDFQRRVVLADAEPGDGTPLDAIARPIAVDPAGAIRYATAVRVGDPPEVDARLDEWTHTPIVMDETSSLLTDSERYGGAADLSARLWFAWDESALYVAGAVVDDDVTAGEAWDRDRINLVFDWREDTTPFTYVEDSPPSSAWQPDDYWVYFQPFFDDGRAGVPKRLDRRSHGPIEGAALASRRTETGYVFEASLPASGLPEFSAFVAHVAGLQVFVSDGDDGEPLTELMWSARWAHDGGIAWELHRTGRLVFADAVAR